MPISRKPLSKAEKSLIFVCVLAAVPLLAIVYVARARDAEPQWDIAPVTTSPKPNGYDFYVAAARATVRFKPEVDPASDSHAQPANLAYALKNYSLARRLQWLQANTETFALINRGLKTPSLTRGYASNAAGDWVILNHLARDMSTRTRTFQMQNEPVQATISALDAIQMGQDTTRGGSVLARQVGMELMALGRAPLEDGDKTINALSATEARTTSRRLEALVALEPTPAQTLTIQKRDILIDLKKVFSEGGWRNISQPEGSVKSLLDGAAQAWQRQTSSKQTIYDNMNRTLDVGIANTRLPYSQMENAKLPSDLDIFTKNFVGSSHRFLQNEARHITSDNMLLLRLALRAYIAEHGAAPKTLSALAPSYLKSIPADVYGDGEPLFYTPRGKNYKLWSVGPDGVDDGGVPFARRSSDKKSQPVRCMVDSTGDFVAGLCR